MCTFLSMIDRLSLFWVGGLAIFRACRIIILQCPCQSCRGWSSQTDSLGAICDAVFSLSLFWLKLTAPLATSLIPARWPVRPLGGKLGAISTPPSHFRAARPLARRGRAQNVQNVQAARKWWPARKSWKDMSLLFRCAEFAFREIILMSTVGKPASYLRVD